MTHKNGFALLFLVIIFHAALLSGQTNSAKINNVSIGYGFAPLEQENFDTYANQNAPDKTHGPIYFKYEHIFFGNLGMGINVAISSYNYIYSYPYSNYTGPYYQSNSETFSSYSILLKMNYHFGNNEKYFRLDPYVGTGVGYRNENYEIKTTGNYYYSPSTQSVNEGKIGFEFTAGFRYLFTPSLGVYMEAGLAKSVFQVGGTFSF